ncbi:hypothetical protein ACXR2T_08490 [Leucobacter sp. HY1910]
MPDTPTLVFLHGVGDGDLDNTWRTRLDASLEHAGYPSLEEVRVITPKYPYTLKGIDDEHELPPVTVSTPSRDAARLNRREFERRTSAIEHRIQHMNAGNGYVGAETVVGGGLKVLNQAQNYLKNDNVRAAVLNLVLAEVPASGNIIIVGHSLGSVIAADLLRRLPDSVTVTALITLGSPLAHNEFDVDNLRALLKEPPVNLGWWVNYWNTADFVVGYRGLSSVFTWMLDSSYTSGLFPASHFAQNYLSQARVAETIGFALFGSRSTELVKSVTTTDLALQPEEISLLMSLRFAHLISMRMKGDRENRFAGALRSTQAAAIDALKSRYSETKRPLPSAIAALTVDLADPDSVPPMPAAHSHLTRFNAAVLFTVLATENPIRPFEIAVPKSVLHDSLRVLAREMQLPSKFADDAVSNLKLARETIAGGRAAAIIKWSAVSLGAVALVAATGGLVLAAGTGLAGAAAITSALATFGPGGMIGGLLTAGTLATAGGGGIAFGLASPSTSTETFEQFFASQLAKELLLKDQDIETDGVLWDNLVQTEMQVRRQYEQLDEFSDSGSPFLKQLNEKLSVIKRTITLLEEHELSPVTDPDLDEKLGSV